MERTKREKMSLKTSFIEHKSCFSFRHRKISVASEKRMHTRHIHVFFFLVFQSKISRRFQLLWKLLVLYCICIKLWNLIRSAFSCGLKIFTLSWYAHFCCILAFLCLILTEFAKRKNKFPVFLQIFDCINQVIASISPNIPSFSKYQTES